MTSRAFAVLAFVALSLPGCLGSLPETRMEAYLSAAAGARPDRGWSFLDDLVRERGYGNDQSRYTREAAAADWVEFRWADSRVVWTDHGVSLVEVDLLSASSTVPAFLLEKRILNGRCRGNQPYGLGAYAPSGYDVLSGGGLSGTQMRCDAQFIGDAAYQRDQN
jgi:hypothetical protein